jgi:two-component system invasion response regulator UvrY
MLKLVLLDPHPVVQKGFKTFFENNDSIIVCDTFTSIDALFEFLSENELDVVIMEMELPDGSAVNTIKKIKKNYPNISILIYTSLPQTIYGISLLKAGALGYLSKQVKKEVLIEAIEKVVKLGYHITSNFANQITNNIDLSRPRNAFGTLSSREIEVLKFIVHGKRNVEISKTLKLSQKTINTYKSRLMKKLEVENQADLYQQARNLDLL